MGARERTHKELGGGAIGAVEALGHRGRPQRKVAREQIGHALGDFELLPGHLGPVNGGGVLHDPLPEGVRVHRLDAMLRQEGQHGVLLQHRGPVPRRRLPLPRSHGKEIFACFLCAPNALR